MEKTLLDNLEVVLSTATQRKCDMRTAASTIAIERLLQATELRGLYP